MAVRVYLDFDGVMNSFSRDFQRLTHTTGFDRWETSASVHTVDGNAFPLVVSIDRNEVVSSWRELGADIIWLSTWWEAPHDVVAVTGIDAPFANPLDPGDESWKPEVIRAAHQPGDRFVWIDDDAVPQGFARTFPNCLLIRPSDRYGLFARDADRVARFLAAAE